MKKELLAGLIICLISISSFSQNSGKGFNYQAIARDINGQVLQNETVTLRFSLIRQNEIDPTWQEKQATICDEFGAFSLTIGQGVRVAGLVDEYSEVNFAGLPFWLKVELEDDEDYYEISFRELISVPYAEVAHNATHNPVGTILTFAGPASAVPDGYMLCDGASLNKNTYSALYAVIGFAWGGNGNQFNLPDLRGNFLRGVSYGTGRDPDASSRVLVYNGGNTGNNVGSYQTSQFGSHNHSATSGNAGSHKHKFAFTNDDNGQNASVAEGDNDPNWFHWADFACDTAGTHKHTITINSRGGLETRPRNAYVNYIIKY